MRRVADARRELVERDAVLRRLDQRDRLRHRHPVAPHLVGLAAQAGAIARGARRVGIGIEHDMLALRPPRGARRLAVDAGGRDSPDHAPVVAAVARLEGGPGGVVVDLCHGDNMVAVRSHGFPRLAIKRNQRSRLTFSLHRAYCSLSARPVRRLRDRAVSPPARLRVPQASPITRVANHGPVASRRQIDVRAPTPFEEFHFMTVEFNQLGLSKPVLAALDRQGLHRSHADPGAVDSAAARRPRPARHRPDRHRQDRGVRAAVDRPAVAIGHTARCRASAACWCSRRRANSPARSPTMRACIPRAAGCASSPCSAAPRCTRTRSTCRRAVDILVATPGRMIDLIEQGHLSLNAVEIFVLDEADQMMDLGFIHALKRVVKLLPHRRQSLFFSATMPKAIRELAEQFIKDPVEVKVAPQSTTAERVEQQVIFVNQAEKQALLTMALHAAEDRPRADLHPHQARRRPRREAAGGERRRVERDPRQQEPAAARARARRVPQRRGADPGRHRHRRARHRRVGRQPRVQLRAAQRARAICPPHRPHRARRRRRHRDQLLRRRREAVPARHREADPPEDRRSARCPRISRPRRPSWSRRASTCR